MSSLKFGVGTFAGHMKYKPLDAVQEVVKKDYSKKIIFEPQEFTQPGHVLQIVTIPPHTKQHVHYHTLQTEVFYILEGECLIHFNGQDLRAKPGDAFICDPGDKHNLWNQTDKQFKLVVFKIDYPKKDDTVWLVK